MSLSREERFAALQKKFSEDMLFFLSAHFKIRKAKMYDERTQEIKERIVGGWETRPWHQTILKKGRRAKVLRINRRAGKTYFICGYLLWKCATNYRYKVLVVTPTDMQAHNIFTILMNEFVDICPEFRDMYIEGTRSKPRAIYFKNGSQIILQTTGTKSGGRGDAIRGQKADLIAMDECDYFNDDDVKAVFPIFLETPDIELIMTSTPSGRDTPFKRACENAYDGRTDKPARDGWEDWSHFHYRCTETLPGWDKKQEANAREMLGNEYDHEMLAEFGKELSAVLRPEDINAAEDIGDGRYTHSVEYYPYYGYADRDLEPERGVNILGVDWDKYQAGPSIVIMKVDVPGADDLHNEERLVDVDYFRARASCEVIKHVLIPQTEFCYEEAVNRIIALVPQFNIRYIYSDCGAAEYQLETLKKHFMDNKSPFITPENIVRVPFGSSETYIDRFSGEDVKVPTKHFMVTLLQQKFQSGTVMLNRKDQVLVSQLRNYRVVGHGPTGLPQFSKANEHSVDAFMLCLLGAYKQLTNISNRPAPSPNECAFIDMRTKVKKPQNNKINRTFIPNPSNGTINNTGRGSDGEYYPVVGRSFTSDFSYRGNPSELTERSRNGHRPRNRHRRPRNTF